MAEPGAREKRASKIRVSILRSTLSLVGKKSFQNLFVDDICAAARVSKVTLFKYFPQKDDILLYYFRYWCLACSAELSKRNLEGMDGLNFLLDRLDATFEKNPGMLLSLISYYASLEKPPQPFPLRPYERKLLFEEEENIEAIHLLSLDQMLDKFLLEAIFKKQITGFSDTRELTNLFLSVVYGTIITAHVKRTESLRVLFKHNIDTIFKKIH